MACLKYFLIDRSLAISDLRIRHLASWPQFAKTAQRNFILGNLRLETLTKQDNGIRHSSFFTLTKLLPPKSGRLMG